VILSQLTDKLLGNHGDDMDKLIEEFYEVLPHKEQFKKSSDWTLREVIGKQDLCQVKAKSSYAIYVHMSQES
jgi:hypothetical protein